MYFNVHQHKRITFDIKSISRNGTPCTGESHFKNGFKNRQNSFYFQKISLDVSVLQSVERQVDHRNVKWLTLYLCCLWTEMAEILFPGTFFQDVWTCKISALHHFYFQSYNTFSWWISNFSEIEWFPWLSLYNSESTSDGELKFCLCKDLQKLWLENNSAISVH